MERLMSVEWQDDWGTPADLDIDTTIEKHAGFSVGEKVVATQDGDEDRHQFWYEGDEGQIIGFSPATKFRGVAAVIYFDGQDPMSCYDLGDFDPAVA